MQSPTTAKMATSQKEYISWERVGRAANVVAEQMGSYYVPSRDTTYNSDQHWNPDVWVYLHRGGVVPAALIWRAYNLAWRPKTFNLIPVSVHSYNLDYEQVGMKIDLKHLEQEGTLVNKDVLIIDDLIDTGQSMRQVKALIEGRGARSIKAAVLFSKLGWNAAEADFVGEIVPDNIWLDFPWEREQAHFV